MNRLIIIGASGHGKVVADIAKLNGYQDIVFVDDDVTKKECAGYPVINGCENAPEGDVIVAIGDCKVRQHIANQFMDRKQPVLIHPSAVIADSVKIGDGSVVMAGAVINVDSVIGRGCIINTCSSVDHDCIIGDYVHVAVGAHICGNVRINQETWIGAGTIIKNNIEICSNCMIGAGALIINNISVSGTYVGVPARCLNRTVTL